MRSTLAAVAFLASIALAGCASLPPAPGPAWRCWSAGRPGLLTCEWRAPAVGEPEPRGGWGCGAGDAGPWTVETCECGE